MAVSNSRLVEKFLAGDTSGRANRMEIREGPITYNGDTVVPDGATAIIGYEWAVYATRMDGGRVTINWGWYKWGEEKRGSQPGQSTTERHLSLIDRKADPTAFIKDRKPQCDSPPDSVRDVCNPRRGWV